MSTITLFKTGKTYKNGLNVNHTILKRVNLRNGLKYLLVNPDDSDSEEVWTLCGAFVGYYSLFSTLSVEQKRYEIEYTIQRRADFNNALILTP